MNWDFVSLVSSTISTLAVVGSVIYLALQVRQSNNISQGQTRTEFRNLASQEIFKVIDFPEILAAYSKPDLDQVERIRLHQHFLGTLRTREYVWLQYRAGLLDRPTFDSYASSIAHILATERARSWWREFRHAGYHRDFVAFVDQLLDKNPPYDLMARLSCLD